MKEIKLRPGQTKKIRIVGSPFQYTAHKIIPTEFLEKDIWVQMSKALEIKCSMFYGDCYCCNHDGDKPEPKWLAEAIDVESNEKGFIKIPVGLFVQLQQLSRDEVWGDPGNYDVAVTISRGGFKQWFFLDYEPEPYTSIDVSVIPQPKDNVTNTPEYTEVLSEMCRPPPTESVEQAYLAATKNEKYKDDQEVISWFGLDYDDWI